MVLDAALLLLCAASALTVSPPTDVTVSCLNPKTTASWTHGDESQTRFRVDVVGSDGSVGPVPERPEPSAREADLTQFVWASAESCMDVYHVTVTATRDQNRSEAVKSKTFSFNPVKTSFVQCQLDFPPVELTAGESEAKVRFQNPLRFYEELNRIEWDEDVVFKYSVRTQRNPNGSVASCRKNQPDCTSSVPLSEGEEPSVRLEGRLCTRDCLREVGFRATGPIFQNNGAKVLIATLTLMLLVLLLVVAAVTVLVCRVRGWTMEKKEPPLPATLVFQDEEKQMIFPPWPRDGTVEHALPVTVISDRVATTTDDPEDEDVRPPSLCSEDGYLDRALSEDSHQSSDRTECVSVSSEDDESVRAYDRPQRLVDMGGGDMVTSYSNR